MAFGTYETNYLLAGAQKAGFFFLTCSDLVSSEVFDHLKGRGDSELLGNDIRLEDAGGSVSSFSAWLAGAATKRDFYQDIPEEA